MEHGETASINLGREITKAYMYKYLLSRYDSCFCLSLSLHVVHFITNEIPGFRLQITACQSQLILKGASFVLATKFFKLLQREIT